MKKKDNKALLDAKPLTENRKYRDVHGEQQLERGTGDVEKTMTGYNIAIVILCIVCAFVAFFGLGIMSYLTDLIYTPVGQDRTYENLGAAMQHVPTSRCVWSVFIAAGVGGMVQPFAKRSLEAQNALRTTADINQHEGDQHIMLPDEVMEKFDFVPSTGAHTEVCAASLISYMAIDNKGIKPIEVAVRAKEDIYDDDGDIEYFKGAPLLDDDGEIMTESKPMFDTEFAEDLWTASGAPTEKKYRHLYRKFYNAGDVTYNKGNHDRDKLAGYDTLADLINNEWEFPLYEVQRPSGVYAVDTAPVNTMVLAMTRAGKGRATRSALKRCCIMFS